MRRVLILIAAAVAVSAGLVGGRTPAVATAAADHASATLRLPHFLVTADGDIACPPGHSVSLHECQQTTTSELLAGSDEVLLLGDNQYEDGTLAEYRGSFDPTWGAY